jgi:hypothetical protein
VCKIKPRYKPLFKYRPKSAKKFIPKPVPEPVYEPIEYATLELRPCSVPASLRSVGVSALEISVYNESVQFHAPDDEFG